MSNESDKELANRMNMKLFKCVSNCPEKKNATLQRFNQSSFEIFNIPVKEVIQQISAIKPKNAMGGKNVPNFLVKHSAPSISNLLYHIFNEIRQKDYLPNAQKLSNIDTIPKTKPGLITKLRPISLLPTISKIFELFYLDYLQWIILPIQTLYNLDSLKIHQQQLASYTHKVL